MDGNDLIRITIPKDGKPETFREALRHMTAEVHDDRTHFFVRDDHGLCAVCCWISPEAVCDDCGDPLVEHAEILLEISRELKVVTEESVWEVIMGDGEELADMTQVQEVMPVFMSIGPFSKN